MVGVLELLATDLVAESDLEAWCPQTGNEFLGMGGPVVTTGGYREVHSEQGDDVAEQPSASTPE